MKPSEIKQELESKSRDELNIIAKKLKIKNRRKLKIDDLISSILMKPPKDVASIIHVTWWDKYHNHGDGFSLIIGLLLGFYLLFLNNNDSNSNKISDSELYVKSTIALENNIFETYLFDEPYNLKLVLQNESGYNWHDLNINISLYILLMMNHV